jgi:predicted metal-dependent phosphoesterase TrpH
MHGAVMSERFIDLHTHSMASDGSCSPSEIIDLAEKMNLAAVALTDHDTVSGLPEFLEAAEKHDSLDAVPGVEISANMDGKEIHIVGLFIDHKCDSLEELLKEVRSNRDNRNEIIIEKLQGMGYDITIDEVKAIAGGESMGRPHFARILIDKGYFTDTQDVFDNCLKRGAPAYCQRVLPSPEKAIEEIHNAGGLAIWAHAVYRLKNERYFVRKTLKYLTQIGLDGVEVCYSTFTKKQQKMMDELADEFNMLKSGGSDFHGANQPTISLGTGIDNSLEAPESLYLDLIKAKK